MQAIVIILGLLFMNMTDAQPQYRVVVDLPIAVTGIPSGTTVTSVALCFRERVRTDIDFTHCPLGTTTFPFPGPNERQTLELGPGGDSLPPTYEFQSGINPPRYDGMLLLLRLDGTVGGSPTVLATTNSVYRRGPGVLGNAGNLAINGGGLYQVTAGVECLPQFTGSNCEILIPTTVTTAATTTEPTTSTAEETTTAGADTTSPTTSEITTAEETTTTGADTTAENLITTITITDEVSTEEPTDTDECVLGTNNCDSNATCSDTVGSFTCACNQGYSGDGVTCTAITTESSSIFASPSPTALLNSSSTMSFTPSSSTAPQISSPSTPLPSNIPTIASTTDSTAMDTTDRVTDTKGFSEEAGIIPAVGGAAGGIFIFVLILVIIIMMIVAKRRGRSRKVNEVELMLQSMPNSPVNSIDGASAPISNIYSGPLYVNQKNGVSASENMYATPSLYVNQKNGASNSEANTMYATPRKLNGDGSLYYNYTASSEKNQASPNQDPEDGMTYAHLEDFKQQKQVPETGLVYAELATDEKSSSMNTCNSITTATGPTPSLSKDQVTYSSILI